MIYTGKKALEQLAILFGVDTKVLLNSILEKQYNNFLYYCFDFHTPSYHLKNKDRFVDDDDALLFSIYMDEPSDFFLFEKDTVKWEGIEYSYFPNPQINYKGKIVNMFDASDNFIIFNTDIYAEKLTEMIQTEEAFVTEDFNYFTIYRSNPHEEEFSVSFEDMKQAVETFVKNKDKDGAVADFIDTLFAKNKVNEVEVELDC